MYRLFTLMIFSVSMIHSVQSLLPHYDMNKETDLGELKVIAAGYYEEDEKIIEKLFERARLLCPANPYGDQLRCRHDYVYDQWYNTIHLYLKFVGPYDDNDIVCGFEYMRETDKLVRLK